MVKAKQTIGYKFLRAGYRRKIGVYAEFSCCDGPMTYFKTLFFKSRNSVTTVTEQGCLRLYDEVRGRVRSPVEAPDPSSRGEIEKAIVAINDLKRQIMNLPPEQMVQRTPGGIARTQNIKKKKRI